MYVFWQFFLELMKVPRVESKLRVFSFKIQFHSQVRWLSILSFFHMLLLLFLLLRQPLSYISFRFLTLEIIWMLSILHLKRWVIFSFYVLLCLQKSFLNGCISYTIITIVLFRSGIRPSWKESCKPSFLWVMLWTMELQEVSSNFLGSTCASS